MIRMDIRQGSPEWENARLSIPTASCFDQILTPAKLKPAAGAETYRNQLLAEWLLGYPLESYSNGWMERGTLLEPEAKDFYQLHYDVELMSGGFCLRDDRRAGCSPDALVGDDGGLETKCPAVHTHVGYLLDPNRLVNEYRGQVQGCLYITGRKWWDVFSYCPVLPPVIVRVEPDPDYQRALHAVLEAFIANLDETKERLARYRQEAPQVAA